jgi:hypothetical protein
VVNWDRLYRRELLGTGAGLLMAFFLASLLHRYRREDVFRLRRFLFWSVVAAFGWMGFGGVPVWNFFAAFLPVVILFATAFFFVMFERLQFRTRWVRRGMVGLFAVLNLLAVVFALLPPPPPAVYPPYNGGIIAAMGRTFRDEEIVATDIPWAVAWYGDRSAYLLPVSEADYLYLNDDVHTVSGIYMTQKTLEEVTSVAALSGYQQFWLSKYGPPPATFPLKFFRVLSLDGQQVLTSNRPR